MRRRTIRARRAPPRRQKVRNAGNTCCEILTPVVLVGLFAFLYTAVAVKTTPDTTFECDAASTTGCESAVLARIARAVLATKRCSPLGCAARYDFAYLPRALNITNQRLAIRGDPAITSPLSTHPTWFYPGLAASAVTTLGCIAPMMEANTTTAPLGFPGFDNNSLSIFTSESDLENYIQQASAGPQCKLPGPQCPQHATPCACERSTTLPVAPRRRRHRR